MSVKAFIKYYISLYLLSSLPLIAVSQTYIGPILGYEYSYVDVSDDRELTFEEYLDCLEFGCAGAFSINEQAPAKSMTYGLQINQQLSSKFSLSLKGQFTRKILDTYYRGTDPFYPTYKYSFDIYRIMVTTQWKFTKNWYIGMGPYANTFGNVRVVNDPSKGWEKSGRSLFREYGGQINIAYSYKNFLLDLNYQHGLIMDFKREFYFFGLRSINLSLGYLFKIRNKKR